MTMTRVQAQGVYNPEFGHCKFHQFIVPENGHALQVEAQGSTFYHVLFENRLAQGVNSS